MSRNVDWYLVSSHGSILFLIASSREATAADLAGRLSVTTRTARSLLADLRRAGMITATRRGRSLYYSVNLDANFRHPVLTDISLRDIFARLQRRSMAARRNLTV